MSLAEGPKCPKGAEVVGAEVVGAEVSINPSKGCLDVLYACGYRFDATAILKFRIKNIFCRL